jgi:hypothetical protein
MIFGSLSWLFASGVDHRPLVQLVLSSVAIAFLSIALLSSGITNAWAGEMVHQNLVAIDHPTQVDAARNSRHIQQWAPDLSTADGSVDLSRNAGKAVDELYRELMRESARLLTPPRY